MSWQSGTATDYLDLLAKLNAFLLVGHSLVPIYSGTGTGTITGLIGTSDSVQETITVSLTAPDAFSVTGSVSGALGTGAVGSAFSCSVCAFAVNTGSTAWIAGDAIAFVMTPAWMAMRDLWGFAASSVYSDSYQPRAAFDGNASTCWASANGITTGTLEARFGTAHTIAEYAIQARNDVSDPTSAPQAWALEYWDGSAWSVADTQAGQASWTQGQRRVFTLASPIAAAKWRLNITANNGSTVYVTVAAMELRESAGGVNIALVGCIWKAPGNANQDEIFVGVQPYYHTATDYYNWRLGAFIGYTDGALFASQPGAVTDCHLPLWNGSIPHWFFADGKRVLVVADISGVYESAHLGFIDTYASPGQYPYPILLGGSLRFTSEPAANSLNWRWSYTGAENSAFWQSWAGGVAAAMLRKFDGNWVTFDGGGLPKAGSGIGSMWPYVIGAESAGMQFFDANLDGSHPLFPIVPNDTNGCYGELDGVAAASGYMQAAEDTVTIDRIPWLLVPNVFRMTRNTFAAFRLA